MQLFLRTGIILVLTISNVQGQTGAVPRAIETEEVPEVPRALVETYQNYRIIPGFSFRAWFGTRRQMLVMAGAEGTSQVFSVVNPGAAPHQLTRGGPRALGAYPRLGRNQFAYTYDRHGDELVQIAVFDTPSGRTTPLTNGSGRNGEPRWSRDGRMLAWPGNERNGTDFDLYLFDTQDGKAQPRLLAELNGLTTITDWSPDGRQIAVDSVDPKSGTRLLLIDVESGDVEEVAPRSDGSTIPQVAGARWSKDGSALYLLLYDSSEFRHLGRLDLETQEVTSLTDDIPWDVDDFDLSDDGRVLAFVVNEDGYSTLRFLDLDSNRPLPGPTLPKGQVFGLAFRPDAWEIGFNLISSRSPSQAYSYIPGNQTLVRWTRGLPGGFRFGPIAEPELIRYATFDGRDIPAFVYRPDPKRFPEPRPVLIDIHGGPQAQFRPGFLGGDHYFINELGLVLIYPNVRGSSGYGRTYMGLDDRRLREDSVKDIGALLDWIGEQPDLDASRVAVTGGSYGGYMVLAALVHFGDRIKAGIDIAGISSFETFMANQENPLRLDLLRLEFGDERDPDTRRFFHSISPLTHADKIQTPLLVVQGVNDPRVPVGEARQIVDAVRSNGVPVWYMLARNEGHGYSRQENMEYLQYVQILFLREHMRKEP